MKITVKTNLSALKKQLQQVSKQATFATAMALTKTAVSTREEIKRELPRVIDKPTPYTMNSMYIRKATPKKLEAHVFFKGAGDGDPKQMLHYLNPLVGGGDRRTKRFEGRLIMVGYMKRGERLVPASGADINQFGNVNPGQITKILSQLRTAVVAGDYSNASNSRRSRRKRAEAAYFWSHGPGSTTSHLARGVWLRTKTPAGSTVRPVFLAVNATRYRRILELPRIAQKVMDRDFARHFKDAFAFALKTARPTQGSLF